MPLPLRLPTPSLRVVRLLLVAPDLGPPEKTLHFCSGVHMPGHTQVPICRTLRPPPSQTPVFEAQAGREEARETKLK